LALIRARATGSVSAEVAVAVVLPSLAVTSTESWWSRSSRSGTYVAAVAVGITWPSRSQR